MAGWVGWRDSLRSRHDVRVDETSARVTVTVDPGDDDPELAERLAWNLQREFEEYEAFSSVGRAVPTAPEDGAKGSEVGSVLEVVVALGSAGLASLATVTIAWLRRAAAREAVLEHDGDRLTLKALDSAEQRELVEKWIERRLGDRRSE